MAARDADARRERLDSAVVQHAVLDQVHGAARKALRCVDARVARCQLRAAAKARAVAGHLGGGGAREEEAVLPARHAHVAHRTAVDAGRRHADVESAVEARIVRGERAVAGVGIERHGRIMRAEAPLHSPFSDMAFGAPGPRGAPAPTGEPCPRRAGFKLKNLPIGPAIFWHRSCHGGTSRPCRRSFVKSATINTGMARRTSMTRSPQHKVRRSNQKARPNPCDSRSASSSRC